MATMAVVLDTDIGQFIDDTFALFYLLTRIPKNARLLVVASSTAPDIRAEIAKQHLIAAGRQAVPVAIGKPPAGKATSRFAGPLASWGAELTPEERASLLRDASAAVATLVTEASECIYIAIGPLTNAADFSVRFPHLAGKCRLVCMAGSVKPDVALPWGETTPVAELNVAMDASAAQTALEGNWSGTPLFADVSLGCDVMLQGHSWKKHVLKAKSDTMAAAALDAYQRWHDSAVSNPTQYPMAASEARATPVSSGTPSLFDVTAIELAFEHTSGASVTYPMLRTSCPSNFTSAGFTMCGPHWGGCSNHSSQPCPSRGAVQTIFATDFATPSSLQKFVHDVCVSLDTARINSFELAGGGGGVGGTSIWSALVGFFGIAMLSVACLTVWRRRQNARSHRFLALDSQTHDEKTTEADTL